MKYILLALLGLTGCKSSVGIEISTDEFIRQYEKSILEACMYGSETSKDKNCERYSINLGYELRKTFNNYNLLGKLTCKQ